MNGYTGSTIDHLNITATDLVASRAFYDAVLPVVGVEKLLDMPAADDRPAMAGYGRDRSRSSGSSTATPPTPTCISPSPSTAGPTSRSSTPPP